MDGEEKIVALFIICGAIVAITLIITCGIVNPAAFK